MLILEYKLRTNKAQQAAIDEAIRTTQFVRNKALRLWMDTRGVGQYDLQALCAQLAQDFPFATRLNSMARQAAADRAWASISRFYKNCREHQPGKKGYPRFQHDNRSVEYKTSGWRLEPDGQHISFTDGMSIGTLRLIGTRTIETFPIGQIKRVRLLKRADGSYVQFAVQAERTIDHQPTGRQVGIDVGLKSFSTDSEGVAVPSGPDGRGPGGRRRPRRRCRGGGQEPGPGRADRRGAGRRRGAVPGVAGHGTGHPGEGHADDGRWHRGGPHQAR